MSTRTTRLALRSAPALALVIGAALTATGCGDDVANQEPDTCAPYVAEPQSGHAVNVRLVNETGADLYLGDPDQSCGAFLPFLLSDAQGHALTWRAPDCASTCALVQSGPVGCPALCQMPSVELVPDGGAYVATWDGTVYTPKAMPEACYDDPGAAQASCLVHEIAPSGKLAFTASAWTAVTCQDGSGGCTCAPPAGGSCTVEGIATLAGQTVAGSAELDAVGNVTVEIVFH